MGQRREVLGGIENPGVLARLVATLANEFLRECKGNEASGIRGAEKKASAGYAVVLPHGLFHADVAERNTYTTTRLRTNGSDFEWGHYSNANCVCKKNTGDAMVLPRGCFTQTFMARNTCTTTHKRTNGSDLIAVDIIITPTACKKTRGTCSAFHYWVLHRRLVARNTCTTTRTRETTEVISSVGQRPKRQLRVQKEYRGCALVLSHRLSHADVWYAKYVYYNSPREPTIKV